MLVGHGTAWTLLAAVLTGTDPDLEKWQALTMPDVVVVEDHALSEFVRDRVSLKEVGVTQDGTDRASASNCLTKDVGR